MEDARIVANHLDLVLHLTCFFSTIASEDECHCGLLRVEHGLNIFQRLSLGKDGRLIERRLVQG